VTQLSSKILAIDDTLRDQEVPHAFGGALALAFHVEEPRGTRDIDVNVFRPPAAAAAAFAALPAEVTWSPADLAAVDRDGQVRLFWGETPVDLFFSTAEFHDQAAAHSVEVPFAGATIPVLGADELLVFKALFDRRKDWADIEEMVKAEAVDVHQAMGWLVDLLGVDDDRVTRLRDLVRELRA
jgi:hypothetical protein